MQENKRVEWALKQKFAEEAIEETIDRLNAEVEMPNPEPAKLLPGPVSLEVIRATVPDLEAFKVLSTPIWPLIASGLERGDLQSVMSNIKALVAGECLTKATAQALAKLFAGKIPDPSHALTIASSVAKAAGFGIISLDEVLQYVSESNAEQLLKLIADEEPQTP